MESRSILFGSTKLRQYVSESKAFFLSFS